MSKLSLRVLILVVLLIGFMPEFAHAYVGPGTGLSAIGSFLALLGGVIIAIIGFLWFPIKRMLGKKKSQEPEQVVNSEE